MNIKILFLESKILIYIFGYNVGWFTSEGVKFRGDVFWVKFWMSWGI